MLLFADSFEHYGADENNMLAGMWAQFVSTPALSTTHARTGSYSLWMDGKNVSTQLARFVLGAEKITVGHGFGFFAPSLPASNAHYFVSMLSPAAANILTLAIQSDGSLCVRSGGIAGAVVEISDSVITAGTFHHIEWKAVFDAVAGSVEVRVNGQIVIQIGGLNLGVAGASTISFKNDENFGSAGYYIDDIFAWDGTGTYCNDFLGPQRMLTEYAIADTAQADFVLNGAVTGFDCINQVAPDGDMTYLSSDTIGDVSEFTLPTLPPELTSITAVFIPSMARMDAAGIGNLQTSLVSGGTPALGPDDPLTPGYTYYPAIFEEDPDTNAPWDKAGLEAAILRLEKTA